MAEVLVSLEGLNCMSPRSVITFLCLNPEAPSRVQGQIQGWYTILHDVGDY